MILISSNSDLRAAVNHSLRFLPAFTLMRKCLRDNYIGNRIDLCDVKIRISSLIDESEGLISTQY